MTQTLYAQMNNRKKKLKGQTLTFEQGEPKQLTPSHILFDAKLQKLGDKKELPASAFLFGMLTS
jgi:hypothetical protein